MDSLLGIKIDQSQKFLENGIRTPVTKIQVDGNVVVDIKTSEKHLYSALQLGLGQKKISKKSKNKKTNYKFLKEFRMDTSGNSTLPSRGDTIKASQVLKPGDLINVTGISKGKGYAGGVKRYHFKGGPRTHGQGDRERAPGSIGQTTTPGRVYKGKRMAGRMGHEKITVKNLQVVQVTDEYILIKGLVPGGKNTLLMLRKVGEGKNFVPLFSAEDNLLLDKDKSEVIEKPKVEEVKAEDAKDLKVEVKEEEKKGETAKSV